jgi:hypothetical protein
MTLIYLFIETPRQNCSKSQNPDKIISFKSNAESFKMTSKSQLLSSSSISSAEDPRS